jgi:(R,R)-butanediol dehydrogenase / meso-butanediol dehydrogenase / diacetyl reductase
MLAARWFGRRDIRVGEVPEPGSPPSGWVRLRVESCGICGTDIEEYESGPLFIPMEPHPLTGQRAPLILGHEVAGVVEEAGPDTTLEPGTRVAVDGNRYCGQCRWCRRSEYQLCVVSGQLGLHADGGLAEQMLAPAFMCIPCDAHVAADHAAMAEPLAVAVRAIRRANLDLNANVAVLGAGPIGLLVTQVARIAGAATVLAVDPHPDRRALALKLGADAAVAPESVAAAAMDLTGGIGPDVVIEAAGTPSAVAAAVDLARRGGTAVLLGVFHGRVPLDVLRFLTGEKQIVAALSHVYSTDFVSAVSLINRNALQLEPLITDRICLRDVVTRGLEPLLAAPSAHLKVMVSPRGPAR